MLDVGMRCSLFAHCEIAASSPWPFMLIFPNHLFRNKRFQKEHVIRTIAHDTRRSFWALADQGIVSLGNFGMNIVLARHYAARDGLGEYGAFFVLMELMFFL